MTERVACNLSLCPLWDRLGGTWRDVTPAAVRLGTTSAPYRHGAYILPDVLRDYRDFLRGLVAGRRELVFRPPVRTGGRHGCRRRRRGRGTGRRAAECRDAGRRHTLNG
ncbi:MAG: hypothetical protein WDN69_10200 [Aliidongia sp.]